MFQETMTKTKRSPAQIVGIVVICVLAVLILMTFVIFGIFRNSNSAPKLFGYRVYVVTNDRMEPRIPNGSAVFVDEGTLPAPDSKSVVLCSIDDQLWVIGYVGTETTETGETSYLVKYDNTADNKTWGVTQNDIIGVAKTYDSFLGWVIRFASSKTGMMTVVIIPCLLVILYEVAMLLLNNKRSGGGRTKSVLPEKIERVPHGVREQETLSDFDYTASESSEHKSGEHGRHAFSDIPEPIIRHLGKAVDPEDIPPEREDIRKPIDIQKEERLVEKQLRKANESLNTAVLETAGVIKPTDIKLDPLGFTSEKTIRKADETPLRFTSDDVKPAETSLKFNSDEIKPAETPLKFTFDDVKPSEPPLKFTSDEPEQTEEKRPEQKQGDSVSDILGGLSTSKIDELIKLLEEEKKRQSGEQ